jgi:hypothetical protein
MVQISVNDISIGVYSTPQSSTGLLTSGTFDADPSMKTISTPGTFSSDLRDRYNRGTFINFAYYLNRYEDSNIFVDSRQLILEDHFGLQDELI